MVDPVRSRIMRSVPRKDTKPEMALRRALHAEGYRFRTNVRALPGSPDIVFTARRKVIFVHGCFWHRHENCRMATIPKNNEEFWEAKFLSNVERDGRKMKELSILGWSVRVVWECEIADLTFILPQVKRFLGPPKKV